MDNDIYAGQAFVDTIVGIPKFTYPAKKNAPRIKTEHATIQLLEDYPVGLPTKVKVKSLSNDDVTVYYTVAMSKLRFRINIIETDGIVSTKIMHGWTSEEMKALMFSSGYGFVKCNPISIEDAKLEKDWERRQGLSLELYAERIMERVTIDNITSEEINGAFYKDGLETILMNIEINKD